jgi:hypothetical protein
MLQNFIDIVGVSDSSDFPIIGVLDRYNQFEVEETLTIPDEKPDIEQITQVLIESKITDYKTIITPTGLKVILNGELTQKVIYVANEPTQSVHSAEFVKPFCDFISVDFTIPAGQTVAELLQTLGVTLDTVVTSGPNILIEDLSVKQIDSRTISKCAILFAWVGLNPLLASLFTPVVP